ncbi:PP2C family protein-serine/threonine phosphatase [Streptomyces sp. PmtG]
MGTQHKWLAIAAAAQAAATLVAVLTGAPLPWLALAGPLLAAHRIAALPTAALSGTALALPLLVPAPGLPHDPASALSAAAVAAWAVFTAHTRARAQRTTARMTQLATAADEDLHHATTRADAAERALARMERIADAAQGALARPLPEAVGHVGLAAYTRPADPDARLGGDVHDAVLTAAGPRLLLADVKGHGADALRVAAAVLAAFRHTAAAEPDPVRLVHALDGRLRGDLGPEDFVTLLLVDFLPGEARVVNCGHPPPLRAGRGLRVLDPPRPSPPLGLDPAPHPYRVPLLPGQRLLLYTDGLTEARDARRAPFSLDTPQVHAALVAATAHDALARLTGLLHRHTAGVPLADDLTLVLAEPTDVPAPTGLRAPAAGRGSRSSAGR